jgi:uncharacterized protein (TIGR02996 family)
MRDSPLVQEFIEEGEQIGARKAVLQVLKLRWGRKAVVEFEEQVNQLTHLEQLEALHALAIKSQKLSLFRNGFPESYRLSQPSRWDENFLERHSRIMSLSQQAFLDAIINEPLDDAPRLIYADWLDEHGDSARAELIRVQCEVARLDEDSDLRDDLAHRESRLLADHGDQWRTELPPWRGVRWHPWRRGFVEDVLVTSLNTFHRTAAKLRKAIPLLGLSVDLDVGASSIASATSLAGLRRLRLSGRLTEPILYDLSQCGHLSQLTELELPMTSFTPEGVAFLASSPHFAHLERLSLRRNPSMALRGMMALIAASQLANLRELDLFGNRLGQMGASLLMRSSLGQNLIKLNLANNDLGSNGVQMMCRLLRQSRLLDLDVSDNGFDEVAAQEIANTKKLDKLRHLKLQGNPIGDQGASSLFQSRHPRRLRTLDLSSTGLTDQTLGVMVNCRWLGQLRTLSLAGNPISEDGVKQLAECPHFAELRWLNLCGCRLGDVGAQALARSPHLQRLQNFLLSDTGLSARTVIMLRRRFGNHSDNR